MKEVIQMASEMVNAVIEAEKKAAEAEQAAKETAARIIADAEATAAETISEFGKQAKNKAKRAFDLNNASANDLIVKAVAGAVKDGAQVKLNAEAKRAQITDAVIDIVIPHI